MTESLTAAVRSLVLHHGTARLVEALASKSVTPIVLKGSSFSGWLYDDPLDRPARDIDLLVPPEKVTTAESALRALGFVHEPLDDLLGDRAWHAHAWTRARDGVTVDLHRNLIGVGCHAGRTWQVLSERTVPLDVGGVTAWMLDEAGRTLHVALHAAQDGREAERALVDLERALIRVDLAVWREAAGVARELDALPAFCAGLALADEGRALLHRLGLGAGMPRSTDVVIRAYLPPAVRQSALAVDWLRRTQGVKAKARLVASKVVPPPAFMRAWSPLARRGTIGLATAYVYRWIWLAKQLPPAVMAWRAARKLARGDG